MKKKKSKKERTPVLFGERTRKSILFMIFVVLFCILITLLYIVTLVIKHYEAFDNDPLIFGANKYGVSSYMCFTDGGKTFNFDTEKIWQTKVPGNKLEQPNFEGLLT